MDVDHAQWALILSDYDSLSSKTEAEVEGRSEEVERLVKVSGKRRVGKRTRRSQDWPPSIIEGSCSRRPDQRIFSWILIKEVLTQREIWLHKIHFLLLLHLWISSTHRFACYLILSSFHHFSNLLDSFRLHVKPTSHRFCSQRLPSNA